MKKITIIKGNEFKVYDAQIKKEDDIFGAIYDKAKEHKEEIENYTANIMGKDDLPEKVEYLNNMIVFCGERGQGKSTAMQYFIKMLKNEKNKEILDIIDPTSIEMTYDIADIIISQLFEQFRKKREEETDSPDRAKNIELVQVFQRVHRDISVLKNSQKFIEQEYAYGSSIQKLSDITDSMGMKQDIIHLVRLYLEYMEKEMLVIPIDDLDLNLKDVYDVAERLRKYFMIPKVIIVLAVNMNQLSLCVERELLTQLSALKDSGRWDVKREVRNMSSRYIEKLIPLTRRLQLPDIHMIALDGADAVEVIYKEEHGKTIYDSGKLGIEKGVLNLIYEKTGLIYIKRPNEIHPIVPTTLRELVNLISLLGSMGESKKENLDSFARYFCDVWMENNLSDEYTAIIREVANTQLMDLQHDTFLSLYEMMDNAEKTSSLKLGIIEPLIAALAATYRQMKRNGEVPSNGDIINCLRVLQREKKSEISRLITAVTTIFSIRMLKLKASESWVALYDFVGGDIFGGYRLIRNETVDGGQTKSRTDFTFSVEAFMEEYNKISLTNYSAAQIKQDLSEENLCDTLLFLAVACRFKDTEGEFRNMVSNNNQIATIAEFNLSQLFLSSVSQERVMEKMSLEKWDIEKEVFENELRERIFRSKTWQELVCNMEMTMSLAQYIQEQRNIKVAAEDKDYYENFFENMIQFLDGQREYLPSLSLIYKPDLTKIEEAFGLMVKVRNDIQMKRVVYKKGEAGMNQTPPSCRRDTRFSKLLKNLGMLKEYSKWQQERKPYENYEKLVSRIDQLIKTAEERDEMEEIGEEISSQYNSIWRAAKRSVGR